MTQTGMRHTNVKKNALNNNFFIGFPPWVDVDPITKHNDRNLLFDA